MPDQTPFANLVLTALGQHERSGISEMLKCIANEVGAYGCILWQVAPGSDFDTKQGHLFVLAEWFNGHRGSALHYLPLNNSTTGKAVLDQRPVNVKDIWSDELVNTDDPFLKQAGIQVMCSIPIRFRVNDNKDVRGAINAYRNVPEPFRGDEVDLIQQLAALIPVLYQTIRNEFSFGLMDRVSRLLHETERHDSDELLPNDRMKEIITQVCGLVSDSLQCVETSIFLEDRLELHEEYKLMGTTWPGPFKKKAYRKGEGMTGWVLAEGKQVRILDLANFERDRKGINQDYPGINWSDALDIKGTTRNIMNLSAEEKLPPLSFMAVPIVKGEKVIGVIRCSVLKEGPYYFADRELDLLRLVAAQISRYWSNWVNQQELHEELISWRAFLKSLGELNSFVRKELTREEPDEHRIYRQALRVTGKVIEGAEIMDVRLLDEQRQELVFAEVYGNAWNEGTEEEIRKRKQRKFSVSEKSPTSAGARVFQSGKLSEIQDVHSDPHYSETFPNTKRMIIAPIRVADQTFGVLDIRGIEGQDFPRHAIAIAELLGQQLGLYSFLAATIGELRKAQTELNKSISVLERLQELQIHTFQDLAHQFKTPIIQAQAQVQLALNELEPDDKLRARLWAIRGLCSKAKRVSYNTELFSALARGEPIELKIPASVRNEDLVKLLIEAAQDNRLMVDPRRDIDFHVMTESFERSEGRRPKMKELDVDRNLLEQAITDILDNAAKYSYRNTVVRISGGWTGTSGFYIAIENRGLPISATEVRDGDAIQRGWRGDAAKDATAEGSGIGLWIVDNIMRAHEGKLEITPTTAKHDTMVRLIFPATRVR
jgi:signal transduction histidine kinase